MIDTLTDRNMLKAMDLMQSDDVMRDLIHQFVSAMKDDGSRSALRTIAEVAGVSWGGLRVWLINDKRAGDAYLAKLAQALESISVDMMIQRHVRWQKVVRGVRGAL